MENMDKVKDFTGLSSVPASEEPKLAKIEKKQSENDILSALLSMNEEKTSTEDSLEINIKRKTGVELTFRVHQLSDADIKRTKKAATTYMKNPNNAKLPQIEKERDEVKYRSLLIYNATVKEDQDKIWGNKQFMEAMNCVQPWESIDAALNFGEKINVCEKILDFSDMNEDNEEEIDLEDYAKN